MARRTITAAVRLSHGSAEETNFRQDAGNTSKITGTSPFCSHRRRRELLEVCRTHRRVSRKPQNVGPRDCRKLHKKIIQSLQVSLHCLSNFLNKRRIDREGTGFHSCPNHKVDTSHSVIVIVRLPISCGLGNLYLQQLKSCRLEHT